MTLFYKNERDEAFYKTCETMREKNLSLTEIVAKAIYTPTESFFISKKEIAKIIRKLNKQKHYPASHAKKALHQEIERRYQAIKSRQPHINNVAAARIIHDQPAPRFYITPARALNLYYEILKNKRRK